MSGCDPFDAAISGSEALKQLFSVTGDDYGEARLNRLERVSLMRRKLQARHRGCVIDPRYSVRMVAWDSLTTVGCLFTALSYVSFPDHDLITMRWTSYSRYKIHAAIITSVLVAVLTRYFILEREYRL